MEVELWPEEYQSGISSAAQTCLVEGIEEALTLLRKLEEKFVDHPAFDGRRLDLEKSILRNVVLVLTLSNERKAEQALQKLLESSSSFEIFAEDERDELKQAMRGKLSATDWNT